MNKASRLVAENNSYVYRTHNDAARKNKHGRKRSIA
jgi:hypothetical protein